MAIKEKVVCKILPKDIEHIANSITHQVVSQAFLPAEVFYGAPKKGSQIRSLAEHTFDDRVYSKTSEIRPRDRDRFAQRFKPDAFVIVKQKFEAVPKLYRNYYIGLLKAVEYILRDPQVAAVSSIGEHKTVMVSRQVLLKEGNVRTVLPLNSGTPYGGVAPWRRLSRFTVRQKHIMGLDSGVFWRHTGNLSRAYKTEMQKQLKVAADLSNYIKGEPIIRLVKEDPVRKKAYAVNTSFRVGIPTWTDAMDKMITDPFMGEIAFGSRLGDPLTNLAYKKKQKTVFTPTTGLDKILLVEASRPWLRRLAFIAGKDLRNSLSALGN